MRQYDVTVKVPQDVYGKLMSAATKCGLRDVKSAITLVLTFFGEHIDVEKIGCAEDIKAMFDEYASNTKQPDGNTPVRHKKKEIG